MKSVLFVCTANRYRSPFAAALFKKWLEEDKKAGEWQVGSAGTWTREGMPVVPEAFQKAQEFGLDLRQHSSVEVSRELLSRYRLVVVMEVGHKEALHTEFSDMSERIFLLSEIVDNIVYDIPDPVQAMDDAEEIMNELYAVIQRGYAAIRDLAEKMFM